ncbi:hypothetical protein BBJ28_00017005 [Nothophytophthora sp. Chile5]|nr:hypothetical protein BBJ28_00017005 [Nothophytophthora sp. Chile5]
MMLDTVLFDFLFSIMCVQALGTVHMIKFIKTYHADWLRIYMEGKKSPESGLDALFRLSQRFCARYNFTSQKPQGAKKNAADLRAIHSEFAVKFWEDFGGYKNDEIYNVDETGVHFDMPPTRIWAERGRVDAAKVVDLDKHSSRLTAVITARADGKKLPILFVVRAKPGGTIESDELPHYPQGHVYAVQENGWMDANVWQNYTKELLKFEVEGPSLLLLDNFDSHVSEEGQKAVAEEAGAIVVPLPPNCTSVCQPLDVGVMGPLKQKIRALWLLEESDRGVFTAQQKRIATIKRTIAAWEQLSEAVIIRAFEKALPRHSQVEV